MTSDPDNRPSKPTHDGQPNAEPIADHGAVARAEGDPWSRLRRFTQARIALGHVGTSLPTRPHLEFQLAHARARDAVHRTLDLDALHVQLARHELPLLLLRSAVADRHMYLQRPDLGRRLDAASRKALADWRDKFQSARASLPGAEAPGTDALEPVLADILFVAADGLSATAIQNNLAPFLDQILPALQAAGWRVGPLVLVEQGRVAVGDEVGELLGVPMVAMLIGERPGLSSPDSMGIYLSYAPRVGMTDAERNCISNIRPEGLSYDAASHKLTYLMNEARRRGMTGVLLKDEAGDLPVQGSIAAPLKSALRMPL